MKIIIAKTFNQKLKGLMGKTNINYGMFFPYVNSIHTFFMKEPIDIIGLNKEMTIMEIHPNITPNHIVLLHKSIHTLELPLNASNKYKNGQKININFWPFFNITMII